MASSVSRTTAEKLRIHVLGSDGSAAPFVRVELLSPPPVTAAAEAVSGPDVPGTTRMANYGGQSVIRALTSSRNGFAIFSLANVPASARNGGLYVRFGGQPGLTFQIPPDALGGGSHYASYQLPPGSFLPDPAPGPWIDTGLDPDDIWIAPGVFPDLGDLEFGDDYCGRLIPQDRTVRIFYRDQIVRTGKNTMTCFGPSKLNQLTLNEGELLHYEVKAVRLGYTFGELLYSLPLAPCESVTLAISHWEQRQAARAEQDTTSVQKQASTYERHNALTEVLSAASTNRHVSGGLTGGWVGELGTGLASIGISVSAGYSRSNFASEATRNFSDSIQSTAEFYRNDHQVVVMEQQETEDQLVSYRTVCNNNHCHVLNIFYHEVLNNYRVTTTLLGHRPVYFVPFEVRTFDAHSAACARPFLLPYLLDQSLADCYRKLKYVAAGQTTSTTGTGTGHKVNQFKVEMTFAYNQYYTSQDAFHLVVILKVGGLQFFPIVRNDTWVPYGGASYAYAINTPDLDPDNIQSVGVANAAPAGQYPNTKYLQIQSLTVSMRDQSDPQWTVVGSRTGLMYLNDYGSSHLPSQCYLVEWHPQLPQPSTTPPPPTTAPALDYQDCLDQVIAHLNCNATYYSMLLALQEDPNARMCRFDKILCGPDHTLADLVEPTPVGVFGCSLAYPKSGASYEPYDDAPIFDERLITLPTPGVFADAALGQCQACETKDDKVYWDWKDTPCNCQGKDVTLATPTPSPLIQAGTSPFPTITTTTLSGVAPPSGEAIGNSLVTSFGSALVTAMLSNTDPSKSLDDLKGTLDKLTDILKDLLKKDSSGGSGSGSGTGSGSGGGSGSGSGAGSGSGSGTGPH